MANIIQIKRSTGATAPTNLNAGELAYTQQAGTQANGGDRLYIGEGSNVQEVIGGKYFTDLLSHVHGVATNGKALIADDSTGALSILRTGTHATAAGTIEFREGTNNGSKSLILQGAADVGAADLTLTLPTATDTLVGKATTDTFTNKSISLGSNTVTMSKAQLNTAISDATIATLTGTETLTNKTLTTPTVNTGLLLKNADTSAGFVDFYEDSDNGSNRVRLIGPASTADVSVILPAASDTLVGKATTDTFTNKTIDSAGNTLTLDLGEGTLTGTIGEFNTALQGGESFATLGGTETISGVKTFSGNPVIAEIDSAGDFTLDATADIVLDAGGSDLFLKTAGTTFGGFTNSGGQLVIKSSSSNTVAATFSGANLTLAGTLGSGAITSTGNVTAGAAFVIGGSSVDGTELGILDGATLDTTELNKLDGVTSTTAELNIVDGDSGTSSVTVVDGDKVIINDGGVMKQCAVTDLSAYFDDEITAMPNLVTTAATTVGALNSGSITSGFTSIDVGAGAISTTGALTGGSLAVDDLSVNGQTISTTGSNKDVIISPHGSGDIDADTSKIINVTDPTQAQDAATKAYVDATKQGLDVKDSCRVATTGNITIATALNNGDTLDGVTLATGDRVLVKDQSTGTQNGIYVVAASPARAVDFDASSEVTSGLFTFVETGTVNSDSGWVLTTDGAITLDSTAIAFTQFSGAGQITAGAGLTKTANTLDVVGTANRISVAADAIDIHTSYAGQASIVTLGTVTTGVWQGDDVGVAYGGTGVSTFTSNGILFGNGAGAIQVTAAGADTYFLKSNSGTPEWSNVIDGGTF